MSNRSPGPLTRQQLYDRIRESSKDEYILSEMIRLGFWNEAENKPSLPADLIKKQGELQRKLTELLKQQALHRDPEKAIKEMHKQRKKAALEKREETKTKNAQQRYERALNWYNKNQEAIPYLGSGHSAGLEGQFTDRERLERQGLPIISDHASLAKAMGVTINELRFLSFNRKTSKISHYQQFLILKKSGGTRKISTPMPRLKRLQYWVLGNVLEKLAISHAAHGFVRGRSIVSNARDHVGKDVVINMDLQDFFPTITFKRVKGLFCHLGYAEKVATVFALLCTEAETSAITLDGETYHVATGERHLPQGAPTSPAISNLICRSLDKRIIGTAKKLGFAYTRYADDLTFSCSTKTGHQVQKLFWRLEKIIAEEGFVIHPNKTRIMRSNSRQEVTGIVVNEKLSVDRKTLKRFRATLHQIEREGPEGKRWGKGELIPSIEGYANFVAMVNPTKGAMLQQRIVKIKQKYGYKVAARKLGLLNRLLMREKSISGEAPRDDWWQAQSPPMPEPAIIEQPKSDVEQASNDADAGEQTQLNEAPREEPVVDFDSKKIGYIMLAIVGAILLALLTFST